VAGPEETDWLGVREGPEETDWLDVRGETDWLGVRDVTDWLGVRGGLYNTGSDLGLRHGDHWTSLGSHTLRQSHCINL
jgi:hypothetical protein